MAYTITQIETAVITALEGLKTSHGLRTLMPYQEELTEESLKRLAASKQLPGIFVIYAGSSYASHGRRKVETINLALFFANKSLSADGARASIYALMATTRDLLTGTVLLPSMLPVEIHSEEAVWLGNGVSIYGANYQTGQGHQYPAP